MFCWSHKQGYLGFDGLTNKIFRVCWPHKQGYLCVHGNCIKTLLLYINYYIYLTKAVNESLPDLPHFIIGRQWEANIFYMQWRYFIIFLYL